jgi:PIN domain nuclease of toxin-antitoxin system
MIVLDTHALLWWALDPDRLSPAAATAVRQMEDRGGYASSISIWELAVKVKRGKLELPITVEDLVRRIERGAVVELLPVDTATWLRASSLEWQHRDPADRVIVATALIKQVPVMTKDETIQSFPAVAHLW